MQVEPARKQAFRKTKMQEVGQLNEEKLKQRVIRESKAPKIQKEPEQSVVQLQDADPYA